MSTIGGLNTAVSGMRAAQTTLRASADNVANARSVAAPSVDGPAQDDAGRNLFRPSRTTLEAQSSGVRATVSPVDPPSVQRFAPDATDANDKGFVNRPNVSLAGETVTQVEARAQFSANLATVETADEMTERLLDISE